MTQYHVRPDFSPGGPKNLTKRILHSTVVLLALIALAVVATVVVYWSFNNGTFTRFEL